MRSSVDPLTSVFLVLLRMHEHVWNDKQLPLAIRRQACELIEKLIIENHR